MTVTENIIVISQYPIDDISRGRIETTVGTDVRYRIVSTRTSSGHPNIFQFFAKITADRIYLFVNDRSLTPLIPVLKVLSLLARSRKRFVISLDFQVVQFGRLDALSYFGEFAIGMLEGVFALLYLATFRLKHGRARPTPIDVDAFSKKHLLYLRPSLWQGKQIGGAISHLRGVVNAMAKLGWQVTIASTDTLSSKYLHKEVTENILDIKLRYILPKELVHLSMNLKMFRVLCKSYKERRNAVLYQRLSLFGVCGMFLSQRLGLPLIIEYNGSEAWIAKNWGSQLALGRFVTWAENLALKTAHVVVTVSDSLRDDLVRRGINPDIIVTYPNGVDLDEFPANTITLGGEHSLRQQFSIPHDAVVATFIGTFGPWHGAEILAMAVKEVLSNTVSDTKPYRQLYALFVGDGVGKTRVEEICKGAIDAGRVVLTGMVAPERVPEILGVSDIVVAPTLPNPDGSPFFGSPTKIFEYMASGRAIVASDVGQVSEILYNSDDRHRMKFRGPGECAYLVESGNVNELADGLRYAIENPKWRMMAGRNARTRVTSKYLWKHHVNAIVKRF